VNVDEKESLECGVGSGRCWSDKIITRPTYNSHTEAKISGGGKSTKCGKAEKKNENTMMNRLSLPSLTTWERRRGVVVKGGLSSCDKERGLGTKNK